MRPFFRTDLDTLNPAIADTRPADSSTRTRTSTDASRRGALPEGQQRLLVEAARLPAEATLKSFSTDLDGLTADAVKSRRARFGDNAVDHGKPAPAVLQFLRTFTNPFILILLFLVVVMVFTDIVFADPADGPDYTGVVTVSIMVLVSATLRFWQE